MHVQVLILIKMFNVTVSFFFIHSRNGYFQYLLRSKGHKSRSRLIRVTVLCSAYCLMVLYICEKFHNNISNGFQLTESTRVHGRNGNVQCSKDNNSKSRQTRVTVHVFCTSSHSAYKFCENILDSINYGADTNAGSADEWTDGHLKFRRVYYNTFATFCSGA